MFTSILAATDRIAAPDPVVVTAARLAAVHGISWSIIHVLESASLRSRQQVLHFRTGDVQPATDAYLAEVDDALRRTYADLLAWAPPCELKIATGFPWEEIAARAARMQADLIVMGPHAGTGGQPGALRTVGRIGSTVEGVITREHAPVLIIREHPCRPKPAFKRILVGIDFSASCECALSFAGELARFFKGTVDLFHMLPVPPYPKYSRADYEADQAEALARLKTLAHQRLDGIRVAYHIRGGALPHQELLTCAAECGADALVLGSHTRETQGKWYAGSTVEKVSAQAPCPVFVLSAADVCRASARSEAADKTAASSNHAIRVFNKKRSTDPS